MLFFFSNDTATTEIYTLSLHDALPIWRLRIARAVILPRPGGIGNTRWVAVTCADRKSTRLNSSHLGISYAVFCLKKKKIPLCPEPRIYLPRISEVDADSQCRRVGGIGS